MKQNEKNLLSNDMEEKLSKLVDSGKITSEQKKLLLEAMEGKSYQEGDTIEIGLILNTDEKDLVVQFISEDIEIIGSNDSQVSIVRGNQYVQVDKTEKVVKIQSKKDELGHFLYSHHSTDLIKINVPRLMPIKIKTISGDIELKNMESNLEIKSVSGDIYLDHCEGKVDSSSISGDLQFDSVKGECNFISKSGDIEIDDCHLSGIIKSYSGDLSIKESNLSNLELSSFSGDIQISNTDLEGSIQLKTFSGDIQADITNQSGIFIGSSSTGEQMVVDVDGKQYSIQNEPVEIGSSDLRVSVKTTSGDASIRLSKK